MAHVFTSWTVTDKYASKKTLFKMRRIAQEQENTDETLLFLRKWRRLSGQVSQKKHKNKTKNKGKLYDHWIPQFETNYH